MFRSPRGQWLEPLVVHTRCSPESVLRQVDQLLGLTGAEPQVTVLPATRELTIPAPEPEALSGDGAELRSGPRSYLAWTECGWPTKFRSPGTRPGEGGRRRACPPELKAAKGVDVP
jgi:hypothetical protein